MLEELRSLRNIRILRETLKHSYKGNRQGRRVYSYDSNLAFIASGTTGFTHRNLIDHYRHVWQVGDLYIGAHTIKTEFGKVEDLLKSIYKDFEVRKIENFFTNYKRRGW